MQQEEIRGQKCYQVACKDISKEQMNYIKKGFKRDVIVVKESLKRSVHIDILFINILKTPLSILTLVEITKYRRNGAKLMVFVNNDKDFLYLVKNEIECIVHGKRENTDVKDALHYLLRGFHYYSPCFHNLLLKPVQDQNKNMGFKRLENGFYFNHNKLKIWFSKSELNVLPYLVQGLTSEEIGVKLFIAENVVTTRLTSIYKKLRVKDNVHALVSLTQKGALKGEDYEWK